MKDKDSTSLGPTIKPFVKAVLDRKAIQVVILDVRQLTSVADAFIICSGSMAKQNSRIPGALMSPSSPVVNPPAEAAAF